jgi:hypothetical protein
LDQNLLSSRLLSEKRKNWNIQDYNFACGLYECETWCLILREEQILRVFEHRVTRIFGLKGNKITGELRKLHNEELRDLSSSPSTIRIIKSRRMRWAGNVARMRSEDERI